MAGIPERVIQFQVHASRLISCQHVRLPIRCAAERGGVSCASM